MRILFVHAILLSMKQVLFFLILTLAFVPAGFCQKDPDDVPTQSVTGLIMDPVMRGESSPTPLTNAPPVPPSIYTARGLGDSDLENIPAGTEEAKRRADAIRKALNEKEEEIDKPVSDIPLKPPPAAKKERDSSSIRIVEDTAQSDRRASI